MTFRRGGTSHPTVTSIVTDGLTMTVHEDDGVIEVPLTQGWSMADDAIAACATRLDNGTIAVDLSFLDTPHRLEIELDPTAGTFVARWPLMPLFGGGLDSRLASIRAPQRVQD